jgi:hypothetical protein
MCWLSLNLGASTFWNPQSLSRPVMGLLYLHLTAFWNSLMWHNRAIYEISYLILGKIIHSDFFTNLGIRYFNGPTLFSVNLIICVKSILKSLFRDFLFAEQSFISHPVVDIHLFLHIWYCGFLRHKYCSIYPGSRGAFGWGFYFWSHYNIV